MTPDQSGTRGTAQPATQPPHPHPPNNPHATPLGVPAVPSRRCHPTEE